MAPAPGSMAPPAPAMPILHTSERARPGPPGGLVGPVDPTVKAAPIPPNVFQAWRIFANALGHTLPNEINRATTASGSMLRAVQ